MTDGPWVLMYYRADGDDRRGVTEERGFYRSRENAQAIADERNAALLKQVNREGQIEHERYLKQAREFNALRYVGLREGDPWRLTEFTPRTSLRTFDNCPDGASPRGWVPEDHWYVKPIEFDD